MYTVHRGGRGSPEEEGEGKERKGRGYIHGYSDGNLQPALSLYNIIFLSSLRGRSCFNAYVTQRFRSTVGKSRLFRDGEKVVTVNN